MKLLNSVIDFVEAKNGDNCDGIGGSQRDLGLSNGKAEEENSGIRSSVH